MLGQATFGGGGGPEMLAGFDINVVTLAVVLAVIIGYAVVYRIGHKDGQSAVRRSALGGAVFGSAQFVGGGENQAALSREASSMQARLENLEARERTRFIVSHEAKESK
jgi:hypothetical protein